MRASNPYFQSKSTTRVPKPMDRLPQINYTLYKDGALRKKMVELGIRSDGSKLLLTRRHTEWVNLVNANCDSKNSKSKKELLKELDVWDDTQGRQIGNNHSKDPASISHKDFDGKVWAANHDSEFKRLIAEAKRKRQIATANDKAGQHIPDEESRTHLEADAPMLDEPNVSGSLNIAER